MNYERPYYEDLNYHPLLFYVVFGVKDEYLKVSKSRHHVDEFPAGLECVFNQKPDNEAYMSEMLGGTLGDILAEKNPDLYERIQQTDKWAIIGGEVVQDSDLNYMRNVIGFVQAFLDEGAIGVLDLQTFTLFSAEEWEQGIFGQEFDPYQHVTILVSEVVEGIYWLHTRGMRKFGRPDIGIENVDAEEIEDAAQVINQMIYYGSLGAFFSRATKLHTHTGKAYIVKPEFVEDFDNPDYNNAYYQLLWQDCELVE